MYTSIHGFLHVIIVLKILAFLFESNGISILSSIRLSFASIWFFGSIAECVLFFIFTAIGVFPNRRVNALYLRSFCLDNNSDNIIRQIRRILGSGFRLSGIRRPGRRFPVWAWPFLIYAVPWYYTFKRTMSLESGADWPARLCRSLGDARIVFIDLSKLTDSVMAELRLVYSCVGPERMFLLLPGTTPLCQWHEIIGELLNIPENSSGQVRSGLLHPMYHEILRNSELELRVFVKELPLRPAVLNWEKLNELKPYMNTDRFLSDLSFAIQLIIPALIVIVISIL